MSHKNYFILLLSLSIGAMANLSFADDPTVDLYVDYTNSDHSVQISTYREKDGVEKLKKNYLQIKVPSPDDPSKKIMNKDYDPGLAECMKSINQMRNDEQFQELIKEFRLNYKAGFDAKGVKIEMTLIRQLKYPDANYICSVRAGVTEKC